VVLATVSIGTSAARGKPTMNTTLLKLYRKGQDLAGREEGQQLVEYALIAALLAFGGIAGVKSIASALNNAFNGISSNLGIYIS
jgi:pilus assembly protein Flp/PilA